MDAYLDRLHQIATCFCASSGNSHCIRESLCLLSSVSVWNPTSSVSSVWLLWRWGGGGGHTWQKLPNRSKPWARSRKSGNTTSRNPRVSWLVLACVCYVLPKSLMKTARLVYHGLWRNSDKQWLTYSVKWSLLIIATQNISICQSRKVPWGTTSFSDCKPPSPFLCWSIESLPAKRLRRNGWHYWSDVWLPPTSARLSFC